MLGKYYIGEFAVSSCGSGGGAAAAGSGGCWQLAVVSPLHVSCVCAGTLLGSGEGVAAQPVPDTRHRCLLGLCVVCLQGGAPVKAAKPVRAAATGAVASSSTLTSLIRALLPILLVLAAIWYMQNMQGKTA
jgi:hypothetical protein